MTTKAAALPMSSAGSELAMAVTFSGCQLPAGQSSDDVQGTQREAPGAFE